MELPSIFRQPELHPLEFEAFVELKDEVVSEALLEANNQYDIFGHPSIENVDLKDALSSYEQVISQLESVFGPSSHYEIMEENGKDILSPLVVSSFESYSSLPFNLRGHLTEDLTEVRLSWNNSHRIGSITKTIYKLEHSVNNEWKLHSSPKGNSCIVNNLEAGFHQFRLSCSQSDGSNEASSTRYGVLLDAPLCHAPSILKKNKTQSMSAADCRRIGAELKKHLSHNDLQSLKTTLEVAESKYGPKDSWMAEDIQKAVAGGLKELKTIENLRKKLSAAIISQDLEVLKNASEESENYPMLASETSRAKNIVLHEEVQTRLSMAHTVENPDILLNLLEDAKKLNFKSSDLKAVRRRIKNLQKARVAQEKEIEEQAKRAVEETSGEASEDLKVKAREMLDVARKSGDENQCKKAIEFANDSGLDPSEWRSTKKKMQALRKKTKEKLTAEKKAKIEAEIQAAAYKLKKEKDELRAAEKMQRQALRESQKLQRQAAPRQPAYQGISVNYEEVKTLCDMGYDESYCLQLLQSGKSFANVIEFLCESTDNSPLDQNTDDYIDGSCVEIINIETLCDIEVYSIFERVAAPRHVYISNSRVFARCEYFGDKGFDCLESLSSSPNGVECRLIAKTNITKQSGCWELTWEMIEKNKQYHSRIPATVLAEVPASLESAHFTAVPVLQNNFLKSARSLSAAPAPVSGPAPVSADAPGPAPTDGPVLVVADVPADSDALILGPVPAEAPAAIETLASPVVQSDRTPSVSATFTPQMGTPMDFNQTDPRLYQPAECMQQATMMYRQQFGPLVQRQWLPHQVMMPMQWPQQQGYEWHQGMHQIPPGNWNQQY